MVSKALRLVNAHFRAISSLKKVVVEVYEDDPRDHIRRNYESHGWTVSTHTTEYLEENDFNRSFSDCEYNDNDYDDGGDNDDDDKSYDIENDSDFWRRACD